MSGVDGLARGGAIICCFSDAHDYRITDGERVWCFDWSDRFGPSLTNGKGTIKANPYPPERSPYWRCVMLWQRQGKRSEVIGTGGYLRTAIYDEPPVITYTIDERGMIINVDEPDGADYEYSVVRYVDPEGNPAFPKRARKRREKMRITIA